MNIFAYGTLICPEMIYALTGKTFRSEKAVLMDFKRYKIYDNGNPRAYPAIKQIEGANVEGVLWYDVDKKSFEVLDFFEGFEYIRTELEVEMMDGKKEKASHTQENNSDNQAEAQ